MNIKIASLIFCLIILVQSCNSIEPPPDNVTISLSLEDAASIEAWIKVTTNGIQLPAEVTLKQNSTIVQDIALQNKDSVIYIDSLLPNQTYKFQAITQSSNQSITSKELTVATMDTTSHNFTWQSWTFGEHSSSVLNDVAIIDENNIWAVGEIYLNDSLGQPDPHAYNAVHWDGSDWDIRRISFTRDCHAVIYPPLRAVWAFAGDDVWFASGGSLVHFDGNDYFNDCRMNSFLTGSINKIWGTSSNDLYIVGDNGNIAHYNGGSWRKLYSATDINLTDVFGSLDGNNIWICGWDNNHSGSIILQIKNFTTELIWDGISNYGEYLNSINTLWTNGGEFWLAGGFVFRHSLLFQDKGHLVRIPTETGSRLFDPGNFVLRTRGTEKNNIFFAGDLGMLWHYNGISWHKYDELYNQQFDRRFYGIEAEDNVVVVVGWRNSNSWIVLGKK